MKIDPSKRQSVFPSHSQPTELESATHASPTTQKLRGMDYASGAALLTPPADYVQMKGGVGANGSTHEAAARGVSGAGGAMPHAGAIQASFGRHDIGGIQAHTGGVASEACQDMGAEAFATGNDVAFKGSPSLHTAAHEAAHVVQQRAGVALKGGVGSVGDAYEQHADEVADLVVQGKSAEGALDRMAGTGAAGSTGVQQKGVQFLRGQAAAVKAGGGARRGFVRGEFTKIRKDLKEYEAMFARASSGRRSGERLNGKLAALIARIERYKAAKSAEIEEYKSEYEKQMNDRSDAVRLEAAEAAKKARDDRSLTLRRVQALDSALLRLRIEQSELGEGRSPDAIRAETLTNEHVDPTRSKDNAVGGSLNKLDKVTLKDGTEGFYKPDNHSIGFSRAGLVGIEDHHPNFAGRAVASSLVDRALAELQGDAPLLAGTQLATKMHQPEGAAEGTSVATTGMFMEKADGEEMRGGLIAKGKLGAGESSREAAGLSDPMLQKALNNMQWLDAICGQIDRHNANFFVARDPNTGAVTKVTGIDNDMAFGDLQVDPTSPVGALAGNFAPYYGLPPFADEAYANAILALKPYDLSVMLAPYLTQNEIGAARNRLQHIHSVLKRLRAEGKFIRRNEWAEKKDELFEKSRNTEDSKTYVGAAHEELLTFGRNEVDRVTLALVPGVLAQFVQEEDWRKQVDKLGPPKFGAIAALYMERHPVAASRLVDVMPNVVQAWADRVKQGAYDNVLPAERGTMRISDVRDALSDANEGIVTELLAQALQGGGA